MMLVIQLVGVEMQYYVSSVIFFIEILSFQTSHIVSQVIFVKLISIFKQTNLIIEALAPSLHLFYVFLVLY